MASFEEVMNSGRGTVGNLISNTVSAIETFGQAGAHALAPDNIEYYMCSLELLDSLGNTKGFLSFVVMPNNIMESKTQIATITKTNKGISTLFNSTFIPRDISIQGTFGRKFRLLLGMKEAENVSSIPFFGGNWGKVGNSNILIKTGYGLMKMLKGIVEASSKLDDKGKPCILLFNNYSLNTHYVVEVMQDSYSQSVDNNMIWYYSLEMKAIAPASAIKEQRKIKNTLLKEVATEGLSQVLGGLLTKTANIAETEVKNAINKAAAKKVSSEQ